MAPGLTKLYTPVSFLSDMMMETGKRSVNTVMELGMFTTWREREGGGEGSRFKRYLLV